MEFDQPYAERTRRSAEPFADASKIVPGGTGSSPRTDPSQYEGLFVSPMDTDADIDQTLAPAKESFKVLAAEAT